MRVRVLLAPVLLLFLCAPAARAQGQRPAPLGPVVQHLARLWAHGDADALVEFAPPEGPLLLDTGHGSEAVNPRHAAAALRALFADRETISLRQVRVTVAGGEPMRGFGELAWGYRTRSAPIAQTVTVYLGLVWTGRSWRLAEVRLMP